MRFYVGPFGRDSDQGSGQDGDSGRVRETVVKAVVKRTNACAVTATGLSEMDSVIKQPLNRMIGDGSITKLQA